MLLVMNGTTETKELLTYNEVAEIFGVTRITVYHWVKAEKLKVVRPSAGTVRFLRSDVEAFIAASRVTKFDKGNGNGQ